MSLEHALDRQTRIISRKEFRRRLGNISRTTEYRLRKRDPDFPKLVWISVGLSGYHEIEANVYIAARPRVAPNGSTP